MPSPQNGCDPHINDYKNPQVGETQQRPANLGKPVRYMHTHSPSLRKRYVKV